MVLGHGIKVVIFDFDGTLFDLAVDWSALKQKLDVKSDEKLGETIQRYHAEGHPDIQHVTDAELSGVRTHVSDETIRVLEMLMASRRIAILTRNTRLAVEKAMPDVANDVLIIGREDVNRMKPDPEGIYKVLEHFNARPQEAVLVGDTYHDVTAAHEAGLMSVVVSNNKLSAKPEGADVYIENLQALIK